MSWRESSASWVPADLFRLLQSNSTLNIAHHDSDPSEFPPSYSMPRLVTAYPFHVAIALAPRLRFRLGIGPVLTYAQLSQPVWNTTVHVPATKHSTINCRYVLDWMKKYCASGGSETEIDPPEAKLLNNAEFCLYNYWRVRDTAAFFGVEPMSKAAEASIVRIRPDPASIKDVSAIFERYPKGHQARHDVLRGMAAALSKGEIKTSGEELVKSREWCAEFVEQLKGMMDEEKIDSVISDEDMPFEQAPKTKTKSMKEAWADVGKEDAVEEEELISRREAGAE